MKDVESMYEKLTSVEAERDTLKIVLNLALKHQVSNLGSKDSEFYTCYTCDGGYLPPWVHLAKLLLSESNHET